MSEETIVPPALYLPIRYTDDGQPRVARMAMEDGKQALLAYTALDRLAKGCGPDQAWSIVFTSTLPQISEETPFDAVVFDVEFPSGLAEALS